MDSNAAPSTPPPADNTDDDGRPFFPHLENITNSPMARTTAPLYTPPGQLESSRTALLRDLGPYLNELTFEFFREHILPRIPKSLCSRIILDKLKRCESIVNGRWKAFPKDPFTYSTKLRSSDDDGNDAVEKLREKEVFAQLVAIIDAIKECVYDGLRKKPKTSEKKPATTTDYESKPDSPPVCCFDEKAALARPDAYFVFNGRFRGDGKDRGRFWRDIATVAEFKLNDTRATLQDVSTLWLPFSEAPHL